MRLLDATTYKLGYFMAERDIPPYAILSHTWEGEEVTLQDLENPAINERDLGGWFKIEKCCSQAIEDGYEWAWIDSCCIDKTSSAELSEAINSMFRWYEKAYVCYAFLVDVPSVSAGAPSSMMSSRWFQRGWTLQELIAPLRVEFYDQNWCEIGTKRSLAEKLSEATTIPVEVLLGKRNPLQCLAGERLSWSSRRYTSREEDGAYCLLGLFDINMPLLYGEGRKAWRRLQEQILKSTGDLSLLLWSAEDTTVVGEDDNLRLFLSSNPYFFHPLRYKIIGNLTEKIFEAKWSRIVTYSSQSIATDNMAFVRSGMRVDLRNVNSLAPELNGGLDQLLWTGQILWSEDEDHVQGLMCIQAGVPPLPDMPMFRTSHHLWLVPVDLHSLATSCHPEPYCLYVTMPVSKLRSTEYNMLRNRMGFHISGGKTTIELFNPFKQKYQWDLEVKSIFTDDVSTDTKFRTVLVDLPIIYTHSQPTFLFEAELCLRIHMLSDNTEMRVLLSVYLDAKNTLCYLRNWDDAEGYSLDRPPRKAHYEEMSDRQEIDVPGTDFVVKVAVKPKLEVVQYQITVHDKPSVPVQLAERKLETHDVESRKLRFS